MAYLGNSPVLSQQEYRNIDDISGSFNGSTTSFPLLVNGVAPIPGPQTSNQCLISVNGVIQKPDDTGASGFRISGGNIVFSSAPTGGQTFFGVILAGADYIYAGENFPDGTVSAPTITFAQDLDTGFYRSGAGEVKFTANGVNTVTFSSNGLTAPNFIPSGSAVPANGIYLPSANNVAIATNSTQRLLIDSAGQIEAVSLGSAAAPTWSFTTDPNTGIYSPGADQVAISTGGSGRLFVDASGNVGVGANPSQRLSVFSGSAAGINNVAIFKGGGSSSGNGAGIILSPDSANTYATWYGSRIATAFGGASWGCDLIFSTNNNTADSNLTERLRITSAGLVGVGTSSPSTLLHIQSTDPAFRFKRSDAGTDAYGELTTDTSGLVTMKCDPANAAAGSGFRITVDNSEALRVDSSGRLGIGTSSPSGTLEVGAVAGAVTAGDLIVTTGSTTASVTVGRISSTSSDSTSFRVRNRVNSTIFVVDAPTERVGIGTTSPSVELDVRGEIKAGNGTVVPIVSYSSTNTIFGSSSGHPLAFVTSNTERARLDTSGRLLVGTSTEVSSVSPSIQTVRAGAGFIAIANSNTVGAAATTLGQIGFYGYQGSYALSATITADADATWSTNDYPSRLTFSTTVDGASSPTERMRITNDGKVFIGTTSAGSFATVLTLKGSTTWSVGPGISSGTTFYVVNGGGTGVYVSDGATSWTGLSDERLKTDLKPITSGLDKISSLRAVTGRYISDTEDASRSFLIAQDVQTVLPEAVDSSNPDELGLRYTEIIPLLVAALKESKERIEQLEAEMAEVKAQLS